MDIFHEYSSIENSYQTKAVDFIQKIVPDDIQWYATEKVHGSNFSATTDGTTVKWAKRSTYINDNELKDFNNAHYVKEKYDLVVLDVWKIVSKMHQNLTCIRIFGEIYGGGYDGTVTSHPKKVNMVQKEIKYCPNIEFIVFDIACIDANNYTFMNLQDVINVCSQANMPCVQIMHSGTLNEMMQLNPKFLTTIPAMHNLPPIENNFAEGFVLKPAVEFQTPRGRMILKLKNHLFKEKAEKRVKVAVSTTLSEPQTEMLEKIMQYINEVRINNVLSKMSENERNFKKISGLVLQDALVDAFKDFSEDEIEYYNKERGNLCGVLNGLIIEIYKKRMT